MAESFDGRRALVTGGANGIGRAVAEAFLDDGAAVHVCDIDATAGRAWASSHDRAAYSCVDVTDTHKLAAVFESPAQAYDIVIANVGTSRPRQPFVETDSAELRRLLEVNLVAAYETVQFAARRMIADGIGGRIIVSCTIGSFTPQPGFAPYCATKYGLLGLIRSVALELAPQGILVNAVCPGDVRTPFLGDLLDDSGVYSGALERAAEPAEIAGAYLWLAGQGGNYAVGEALVLDGGLSLSALR